MSIFNFFKDVLLYFIMFCNVYTLTMHHMILYQQFQNILLLCVKTQFLIIFNCFFKIPVQTGFSYWLPIYRAKNWTGPDLQTISIITSGYTMFLVTGLSNLLSQIALIFQSPVWLFELLSCDVHTLQGIPGSFGPIKRWVYLIIQKGKGLTYINLIVSHKAA